MVKNYKKCNGTATIFTNIDLFETETIKNVFNNIILVLCATVCMMHILHDFVGNKIS